MTIENYIEPVQRATQDNDHTGAIKLVAMYAAEKHKNLEGVRKLQDCCDAIDILWRFHGYMPQSLDAERRAVRKAIFSLLDDAEQKRFNSVM